MTEQLSFLTTAGQRITCPVELEPDVAQLPGSPFRDRGVRLARPGGTADLQLPADTVRLLQRRIAVLPPPGTWRPYDKLDAEIRIGLHLARRFGVTSYPQELSKLLGYDADAEEPFVLLLPYAGVPTSELAGRLTLDQQRRFEISMFRTVRMLEAAQVVHGGLSPNTVRWDEMAEQVQVTDFSRAVLVGEPRPPADPAPWLSPDQAKGLGDAETGDDIWSAGWVTYHVTTGRPVTSTAAPPDLQRHLVLHEVLAGAFAPVPAARPSAEQVLTRLKSTDPWLGSDDYDPRFAEGEREFDQLMAQKAPVIPKPPAPAPAPQPGRRRWHARQP